MYGAVIGDIVGSKYEFDNIKTKDFPLLSEGRTFTDDTILTVAVARALMQSFAGESALKPALVAQMRALGRRYADPQGGYGCRFSAWLRARTPKPYHSFGNGAAMRVSPCGLIAATAEEAAALARTSAEVTHDHPEGIRGAQAVAVAMFMAKTGRRKKEIAAEITARFYTLPQTLAEVRPTYRFDESCQGTVPQTVLAFLESTSYEDAVRNAVSLGGDSDTLAAITGNIAWPYYRFGGDRAGAAQCDWPLDRDRREIDALLPQEFVDTIEAFSLACKARRHCRSSENQ